MAISIACTNTHARYQNLDPNIWLKMKRTLAQRSVLTPCSVRTPIWNTSPLSLFHYKLALIMNFSVMHSIKQLDWNSVPCVLSAPQTLTNFWSSSKPRLKPRPKLKNCVMNMLKLTSSEPITVYNCVVKIGIMPIVCQKSCAYEMCSVRTPPHVAYKLPRAEI